MSLNEQQQQDEKDIVYFMTKEELDEEHSKLTTTTTNNDHYSTISSSSDKNNASSEEQQAYNPETGEINWDCPCIAGMTKPPCGDAFKEAFSCFVYSESEPKGADCIDQFRAMQSCFQQYPEIYGSELEDDEDEEDHGDEAK